MKDIVKIFKNIKQFNCYLENGKTQEAFKSYVSSMATHDEKKKDSKTKDYAEANDLLLYGDKATAKKINDGGLAKVRCEISKDMVKREIYTSVVGFAPNVPAYLAGSPASMIAIKQKTIREKVINIHYNVATSWQVKSDDIIDVASRFLSALCKIEAGGLRINLTCGFAVRNHSKTQMTTNVVKIKDSKEKLDVLKVAYPLVHPSMQRRHCFRFLEVTEGLDSDFSDGYGRCIDSQITKKLLNENGCDCDCVVCYYDLKNLKVEDIIKYIEKEISKGKAVK